MKEIKGKQHLSPEAAAESVLGWQKYLLLQA